MSVDVQLGTLLLKRRLGPVLADTFDGAVLRVCLLGKILESHLLHLAELAERP